MFLLLILLIIIVVYDFVLLVDTVPGSRFFLHGLFLDVGACRAFPHGVARSVNDGKPYRVKVASATAAFLA